MRKVIVIGAMILSTGFAFGASYDDTGRPVKLGSQCFVRIDDSNTTRVVNVNYIRMIHIDEKEPQVLKVSLASNYSQPDALKHIAIDYSNSAVAHRVLIRLQDEIIKNCRM